MKSLSLVTNDDGSNEELGRQNELAREYAQGTRKRYAEYIAEFPIEEGYSPDAKEDAVFTIVREFLEWCAKKP